MHSQLVGTILIVFVIFSKSDQLLIETIAYC